MMKKKILIWITILIGSSLMFSLIPKVNIAVAQDPSSPIISDVTLSRLSEPGNLSEWVIGVDNWYILSYNITYENMTNIRDTVVRIYVDGMIPPDYDWGCCDQVSKYGFKWHYSEGDHWHEYNICPDTGWNWESENYINKSLCSEPTLTPSSTTGRWSFCFKVDPNTLPGQFRILITVDTIDPWSRTSNQEHCLIVKDVTVDDLWIEDLDGNTVSELTPNTLYYFAMGVTIASTLDNIQCIKVHLWRNNPPDYDAPYQNPTDSFAFIYDRGLDQFFEANLPGSPKGGWNWQYEKYLNRTLCIKPSNFSEIHGIFKFAIRLSKIARRASDWKYKVYVEKWIPYAKYESEIVNFDVGFYSEISYGSVEFTTIIPGKTGVSKRFYLKTLANDAYQILVNASNATCGLYSISVSNIYVDLDNSLSGALQLSNDMQTLFSKDADSDEEGTTTIIHFFVKVPSDQPSGVYTFSFQFKIEESSS